MHKLTERNHDENIPAGYCQCGCGKKTKICTMSSSERGRVRGEPFRFLQGHGPRKHHVKYIYDHDIGYGYCHCGCGEKTAISEYTHAKAGMVKGKPKIYVSGHNGRPTIPQYAIDTDTGCWNWQWQIGPKGYGRIKVGKVSIPAHRHFYEHRNGSIPDGLEIDHLCRNRRCVNPDHLEAVTTVENVRRGLVAKINIEIARAIKSDLQSMRICDAARNNDVSYSTAYSISRGVTWKDA